MKKGNSKERKLPIKNIRYSRRTKHPQSRLQFERIWRRTEIVRRNGQISQDF